MKGQWVYDGQADVWHLFWADVDYILGSDAKVSAQVTGAIATFLTKAMRAMTFDC